MLQRGYDGGLRRKRQGLCWSEVPTVLFRSWYRGGPPNSLRLDDLLMSCRFSLNEEISYRTILGLQIMVDASSVEDPDNTCIQIQLVLVEKEGRTASNLSPCPD